jgi:hypothetical protein
MDRIYLFVPPEEKAELESLGAHWDTAKKCWYLTPTESPAKFSRWLPSSDDNEDNDEEDEFPLVSDDAFVAATTISCHQCGTPIEVICIHCITGTSSDEPLTLFTVSDIYAMDEALARQLKPWPTFRRMRSHDGAPGNFANHCPHCDAIQDDLDLHTEPDSPFFDIPYSSPDSIQLAPLIGTVRLAGDEHFTIE